MLIKSDEFSSQVLYGIYRDAYMEPSVDDDGDVLLRVEGLRIERDVECPTATSWCCAPASGSSRRPSASSASSSPTD